MAYDYGLDLACTDDMTIGATEVSGTANVAQAIYRRLISPRGSLIDDPDYGSDVTLLVDDVQTSRQAAIIAQQIDTEARKDERVLASQTQGEFRQLGGSQVSYLASTVANTAEGPFRLVLSITNVSVDVLQIGR